MASKKGVNWCCDILDRQTELGMLAWTFDANAEEECWRGAILAFVDGQDITHCYVHITYQQFKTNVYGG